MLRSSGKIKISFSTRTIAIETVFLLLYRLTKTKKRVLPPLQSLEYLS